MHYSVIYKKKSVVYTQKKNLTNMCVVFTNFFFLFSVFLIERQHFLGDLQLQVEAEAGLSTSNAYLDTFSRDPIYCSWCENAGHKNGKGMVFHLKH